MDTENTGTVEEVRKAKPARRKKRKSNKPEMLWRQVQVTGFRATVRLRAVHPRGEEPFVQSKPWLELRGTFLEAISHMKDVAISMYPEDKPVVGTSRPAAIGAIVQTRPEVHFVLTWPHSDFDRVWALAVAGQLTHAHLAFTKPHYNSGLVVSASFANVLEE